MRARVFKFLIHLESGQIYCGTENQDDEIYFYYLFSFFLFSISHSNVIHREICVKDFSGTTAPRILKFGTNVGCDLLYCVRENQHAAAYHSPYLSIFLPLQAKFLSFYETQSLQIFIHIGSDEVYCGTENKTEICVAFFLLFSISHSNLISRKICDIYFSRTIAHRIL